MAVCNNCHQSFEGKYCSHCGQKATAGRLSLHEIFHDLLHSFTHAEKGILLLIKELIFYPGKIYKNYFSGRRKTYFSPVTFFLLMVGLALFLGEKLIDWDQHVTGHQYGEESILFGFQKIRYLIFIPLISFVSWGFFYKKYNLAECLTFWFFCMGMVILVELISYIPQFLWVKERGIIKYFTDWVIWILILVHIYAVFFDKNWWSGIKCFVLGVSAYFFLVYIASFLAYTKGINTDFNFWHILESVFK